MTRSAETGASRITLLRGLGPLTAAAIVIGDVIGTGVFLKARVMTCNVETPGMVVAAWVLGGLLSLAGALTFAELAAMMPRAGGEYVFIRAAYGPLPGFLYGWTRFFVANSGSMAGLAAGFAIFANVITRGALDTFSVSAGGIPIGVSGLQAAAIISIVAVTILNCGAIAFSGKLAAGFTLLKVSLVVAVGVGAWTLADGSWTHFALSTGGGGCSDVSVAARGGAAGFGAAMLGALWAYNGWNEVTYVAEEVRNPGRTLPTAIIGGISVIALLYVFANVMYFYVFSPAEIATLSATQSVATEVVTRVVGRGAAGMMAAVLAVSIFGSLLISSLACARIPYAMARDRLFLRALDRVNPRTHVPVRALIAQAAWAIVLVLSGSYDVLTDYAIFSILIFVSLAAASIYVFRARMPSAERPYRTWGYPITPALFLLVTGWIIVNTVMTTPGRALAGLGLMALGLPFYYYWSSKPA